MYVYQIGKKFFLPGATKEDLVQEGMIGLFYAIINYQTGYNTSFDDYVSLSIRNRVLRAVRMATQLKQRVLSDAFSIDEDPFVFASLVTDSSVEETVVGRVSINEMSRFFKKLLSPMEYRIVALKITEVSVEEVARLFGLSKKQVENALFRARKKISIFLKNEFDIRRQVEDDDKDFDKFGCADDMDYEFNEDDDLDIGMDLNIDFNLALDMDIDLDMTTSRFNFKEADDFFPGSMEL